MPTFDPEKINASNHAYVEREVAKVLLSTSRDYMLDRLDQEAERGAVATYTPLDAQQQQIAIVRGIHPVTNELTTFLLHNEIEQNPNFPGGKLMILSAWTINKTQIGFRQECISPVFDEEDDGDVWQTPKSVPMLQNYADEDTDGEVALHLIMEDEAVMPELKIRLTNNTAPTRPSVRALLRACDVLYFCNETAHNEYVTRLV